MRRLVNGLVGLFALVAAGTAHASTWTIDSAHTGAQFGIRHLMVSTVRGTMGRVSGTVHLDEADLTKSSVEATIDVTGIDTRDSKRDEHLRNPDFLDAAKYPTITFTSTSVTQDGPDRFSVAGNLTLHGVTKPVVLQVEGAATPMKDPFGNTKLGGVARTRIDRRDFGVVWSKMLEGGGLVVGTEVDITIDLELTRTPPSALP